MGADVLGQDLLPPLRLVQFRIRQNAVDVPADRPSELAAEHDRRVVVEGVSGVAVLCLLELAHKGLERGPQLPSHHLALIERIAGQNLLAGPVVVESADQTVLEPARAAQAGRHHLEHHHGLHVDVGRVLAAGQCLVDELEVYFLVGCPDLKLLPEARVQEHRPGVDLFVSALDEPPVHIEGGSEALQFRAVAVSQQLPARLLQKPLDRVVALVIAHRQRLLHEAAGVFRGLRIHDVRPCRPERMVDARALGIRSDVQLAVGKPSVPVQVGQQVGASRLLAERLENGPFVGLSGGLHVDRVVAVVGLESVSRMPAAGQGAGQDRHLPEQLPTVFGKGPVEDLPVPPKVLGGEIPGPIDVLRNRSPVVRIPRQVREAGVVADRDHGAEHVVAHPRPLHEPVDEESGFEGLLGMLLDRRGKRGTQRVCTPSQRVAEEIRSRQRTGRLGGLGQESSSVQCWLQTRSECVGSIIGRIPGFHQHMHGGASLASCEGRGAETARIPRARTHLLPNRPMDNLNLVHREVTWIPGSEHSTCRLRRCSNQTVRL